MNGHSLSEEELELLLDLQDEECVLATVSTPRQRLEDARTLANGVVAAYGGDGVDAPSFSPEEIGVAIATLDVDAVDDGSRYINDLHREPADPFLQRLSGVMADGGMWKYFHNITRESESTLAEMNASLGAIRQWRKQREEYGITAKAQPSRAAEQAMAERSLGTTSDTFNPNSTSHAVDAACDDPREPNSSLEEEYSLQAKWQHQHSSAQRASERLQVQLHSSARHQEKAPPVATDVTLSSLADLTREGSSDDIGGKDSVARLLGEVRSLEMHQLISSARVEACDKANASACQACEEVWQGAGPVGEMEGELSSFTDDLDSLLIRLDSETDRDDHTDDTADDRRGADAAFNTFDRAPLAGTYVERAQ